MSKRPPYADLLTDGARLQAEEAKARQLQREVDRLNGLIDDYGQQITNPDNQRIARELRPTTVAERLAKGIVDVAEQSPADPIKPRIMYAQDFKPAVLAAIAAMPSTKVALDGDLYLPGNAIIRMRAKRPWQPDPPPLPPQPTVTRDTINQMTAAYHRVAIDPPSETEFQRQTREHTEAQRRLEATVRRNMGPMRGGRQPLVHAIVVTSVVCGGVALLAGVMNSTPLLLIGAGLLGAALWMIGRSEWSDRMEVRHGYS